MIVGSDLLREDISEAAAHEIKMLCIINLTNTLCQ